MTHDKMSDAYFAFLEKQLGDMPSQLTDYPELDDVEPEPLAFDRDFINEHLSDDPVEDVPEDDVFETVELLSPRIKRLLGQAFGIFVLTIFGVAFVYALIEGPRVL